MSPTPPLPGPAALLVLDAVERDSQVPTRLVGWLRIAGHRMRIVLDFALRDLGLIEQVEVPWLLGAHAPSQRAVITLLERIDAGEAIGLPRDLSEEVRDTEPPFPLRPLSADERAQLEAAAAQVPLEVLSLQRSAGHPARVSAHLLLAGQPLRLEVELHEDGGPAPLMRWLSGPDPATLSEAQRYAIQRALAAPPDTPY